MKRILLIYLIVAISSIQSCVNTSEENYSDSLHNEKQLANELVATWKFSGRFSIERNNWIPAGPEQLFVYEFKADGTFSYNDPVTGELLAGGYKVIPATDKVNPSNSIIMITGKYHLKSY